MLILFVFSGTDQDTNDAMVLVKKIVETIESVLHRGTNWNKEKLTAVLKKMKKDVSCFLCWLPYCRFGSIKNVL